MPRIVEASGRPSATWTMQGSLVHLPEQSAVGGLGPPGLADGPVQVARSQVVPETSRPDVRQRMGLVVLDHLRVGDRAAREVQQQRVAATGRVGRGGGVVGHGGGRGLEVRPARRIAEPRDEVDRGPVDLRGPDHIGDRRPGRRRLDPVGDVLGRQQRRAGHRSRADADAAQHCGVPLGAARQHDEHAVAAADAEVEQCNTGAA
jgi:hypothetical protein